MTMPNAAQPGYIDTHAHLDSPRFDGDLETMLDRAWQRGLTAIVTIGTGVGSSRRAVTLAEFDSRIHAAVGIDPHSARTHDGAAWAVIRELAGHARVIALGETGLDYHYYLSPESDQKRCFRAHIQLALETGLPLVIHNRESDGDLLAVLDEMDPGGQLRIVMHSFSGAPDFAVECLARGYFLSFSGMLTFKSMPWLRAILAEAPIDRLLFETDAPYLAPVPYRGSRNEPAFVAATMDFAAGLLNMSPSQLCASVTATFHRIFTRA
ncbi:TatD family hydrolase [bacterium]|nr:TatD family hydrolase [candidate division CSSED10-310 bacterium]